MKPNIMVIALVITGCASGTVGPKANDETPAKSSTGDGGFVFGPGFDWDAGSELDGGSALDTGLEWDAATEWDATTEWDAGMEDAAEVSDASAPKDAAPDGACAQPLGPGDLAIEELMISSVSGSGDYGEWLEVRSQRDCKLNLRGLRGECPHGAQVATFEIADNVWLAPRGSFLVANSEDPAINHHLPGIVVSWGGSDLLRNQGTTITLLLNAAIIASVTYPSLTLIPGKSLTFPSDCDPAQRSDWTSWSTSTGSWFPGFWGTPNAPNNDVRCRLGDR
jgi:hypothetical protein